MKIVFIAAAVALAGCATKIQVDYGSDPPGATLYQNGQPMGTTPMSLYYEPAQAFKDGGCQRLDGTSVKWASGAAASIGYLQVCRTLGMTQHYIFNRPDVPGREIDANHALQLQRNSIMRRQADNAAIQNYIQSLNPPQQPLQPLSRDCRSVITGNTVQTQCW